MGDDRNFWADETDAMVIRHQPAVAVYTCAGGGIIVRQEDQYAPEHDAIIRIDPAHARTLARAILAAAGPEAEPDDPPVAPAARAPLTNAERQRRYRARRKDGRNDNDPPLPFGDAEP